MLFSNFPAIIKDTLLISSYVFLIMLIIEFINSFSEGKLIDKLNKGKLINVVIGTLLGLAPGCIGTFTAVSLYSNRLLSFGGLLASMIATVGDEAFFMIAYMPKYTVIIFFILTVLAISVGLLADFIISKYNLADKLNIRNVEKKQKHEHSHNECSKFSLNNFKFQKIRIVLLAIVLVIFSFSLVGIIGHVHNDSLIFSLPSTTNNEKLKLEDLNISNQEDDCARLDHDHHHQHNHSETIDWVKILMLTCSVFALIIISFASYEFLNEHLWKHLVKKHLIKIILWTLITLIIVNLLLQYANFGNWIYNNMLIVLFIALIIGLIPQSGPHIIFIILFIQNIIPLSVLLANSIVQNGHGPLPLLAESKKNFIIIKIICLFLGIIVGFLGYFFNF